jgi:hypothetical protein
MWILMLKPLNVLDGFNCSFGIHHFILFGRNEMKSNDMMISFYFGKSTEMTGYPIGIKVRHKMKNHKILNEFPNQFRGIQTSNC